MSTKVPKKNFDNLFDNAMYNLSEKISPTLYKYNITPNQITILGIISGLVACYYLYIDQLHLSLVFIILSCFIGLGQPFKITDLNCNLKPILNHTGHRL